MKQTRTFIYFFLALLMTLTLSGCFSTTKIVTKTVTLYQEVPSELTVPVNPRPPVDKVSYLAMPIYERELYLANYSVDLLKGLYSCNAQLDAVSTLSKQWKARTDENKP